jgi:RNA methyltransferase, TrmH family
MKVTPLTSPSNPLLKHIRGLQQRSFRDKSRQFLIEGPKVIAEALSAGIEIKDVVISQSYWQSGTIAHELNFNRLSLVEDKLFAELITTESSCGVLAVAHQPAENESSLFASSPALVVIAENIQDPGNLGTIIRTSLAAEASGIILTKGTVDPYNPKVVRSAAGALFKLPLITGLTIDESIKLVKNHQLQVLACCQGASQLYWDANLKLPTALVFGNEGQGFKAETRELCDGEIAIPMSAKSESLNVAMATGIILFAAVQQRRPENQS